MRQPLSKRSVVSSFWIAWLLLAFVAGLSGPAAGQVFGPGPSDSSLFDEVITLPDDQESFSGGIGLIAGQTIQMNVTGGTVGDFTSAGSGSEVNISGGEVGSFFTADAGSEINVSGGTVGADPRGFGAGPSSFRARSGSVVTVSGGLIGEGFTTYAGSDVELIGGEFRVDGAAFGSTSISLGTSSSNYDNVFTGTLADGSSFIFSAAAGDQFDGVTLTPSAAPLPAIDPTPIVVATPINEGPFGLRAGQTMTVESGGVLSDGFAVVGGTLNVRGGEVGRGLETANGAIINISGGTVGTSLNAFDGTVVNISGGIVGGVVQAFSGSEFNISGGSIGHNFDTLSGSRVNISGGTVRSVSARSGSEVNISGGNIIGSTLRADSGSLVKVSGGAFGSRFNAQTGSDVELIGGEFRLNGTPYNSTTITLANGDRFTGTLADGSAFIFYKRTAGDSLNSVTLTTPVAPLSAADLTPIVVTTPMSGGPSGLRAGQTMSVENGGVLGDNFAVVGARLNVRNGSVGETLEASDGAIVTISGGTVGASLTAFTGAQVNITGGTVGGDFVAFSGSVVNITGGIVGRDFDAFSGSEINISGGTLGEDFDALAGSTVNLVGFDFMIDGVPLHNLEIGRPVTIEDRNVVLTGSLSDGSPSSFYLRTQVNTSEDHFSSDALLTITLVESGIAGDFNNDGKVNAGDYALWRDNLNSPAGTLFNDADGGMIGSAQYDTWVANYGRIASSGSVAVPEPTATGLVIVGLLTEIRSSHRRRRN